MRRLTILELLLLVVMIAGVAIEYRLSEKPPYPPVFRSTPENYPVDDTIAPAPPGHADVKG